MLNCEMCEVASCFRNGSYEMSLWEMLLFKYCYSTSSDRSTILMWSGSVWFAEVIKFYTSF